MDPERRDARLELDFELAVSIRAGWGPLEAVVELEQFAGILDHLVNRQLSYPP
jgi:hypothetical protein